MLRTHLVLTSAFIALASATAAHAAEPAGPTPGSDAQGTASAPAADTQGGEIIVTANRREQTLKDVPLSVSAVSQDEITKRGVQSVLDLSRAVPGLVVNEAGPGENRIFLSGVANPNSLTSLVGIYVDEIPVTGQSLGQPDLQLVDLERVEVLRGPQGTLYGQGSAGGTVRFITAKPDLANVSAELTATGYATEHGSLSGRFTGMVNIPLVNDVLGLRISGVYGALGGWINQPAANLYDINNQSLKDVRIKALLKASAELSIEASVNIHRNEGNGLTDGADANYNVTFADPASRERFFDDFTIYNLTATYDFGGAKLMSATSYVDSNKYSQGIAQRLPTYETFNIDDFLLKQFSQELRLSGGSPKALSWVIGAFYTNDKLVRSGSIGYFVGGANLGAFPNNSDNKSETISGYGDVSYAVTPRFTLGTGLRYFDDSQRITLPTLDHARFHDWDPRFYGSYAITDSTKIYFNIAKGFRSGGFEGDPGGGRYGPEQVWSYETGLKGSVKGFRWNLGGYYSVYDGYQAFAFTNPPYGGYINAGRAHIKGIDFDFAFTPISALSLSLSGNVNDGHFVQVNANDLSNIVGDRIDYIPDYSVTASTEYRFKLGSVAPAFFRIDYTRVGPASYTERQADIVAYKTDTLNLLGARAGVTLGAWSIQLFGENLLGDNGVQDPLYVINQGSRVRPRTGGIRIGVNF